MERAVADVFHTVCQAVVEFALVEYAVGDVADFVVVHRGADGEARPR